jgi:hypothetical protein
MWSWGKKKPAEPSAAQKNANRLARLSFAKGVGAPSSRASTRSSSEPVGSMAHLAESPAGSNDEGAMEVDSLATSSRGASSTGSAPVLNMYRSPAAFGQRGTMKQARNASRAANAARAEAAKAEANAAAVAVLGAAVVANATMANAHVANAGAAHAGVNAGAAHAGVNAGAAHAGVVNAGSMPPIGGRSRRRNKRRTYRRR